MDNRAAREMRIRIVSFNIERLLPSLDRLTALHECLGDPDLLLLQEVCLRPEDTADVARMAAALPGFACHWSLARDRRNVSFRGGRAYGVATYVRASLGTATAEVPEWDREGRVVVTRVAGLAIGNVYAVNGTARPYFDHELGRVDGDRHAFKRRFQARVLAWAEALRTEGGVVMAGDWNVSQTKLDTHPRLRTEEPHARAREELAQHLARAGVVDVWRRRNPTVASYTWHRRHVRWLDAARVDFILVSEDLEPRVVDAAILGRRPESDHAPIAVTLELG